MKLKKAGAIMILSTLVSSPLAVWGGKQLLKVPMLEEKIKTMESNIYEIHWYLIKKNDVKVPSKK